MSAPVQLRPTLTILHEPTGDVPALLERVAAWLRADNTGRRLIDLTSGWREDGGFHVYLYTVPAGGKGGRSHA